MVHQTTRAAYFPNGHRRSQYLLLPTWFSTNYHPIQSESNPSLTPRYQTRGQVVNVNQKPEVKYPVTVRLPSPVTSWVSPLEKGSLKLVTGYFVDIFLMFFSSKIGKNNDLTTIPIEEFIFLRI